MSISDEQSSGAVRAGGLNSPRLDVPVLCAIRRVMPEVDLLKQAAVGATERKVHDPQAEIVVAAHVVRILRAKVRHLADDTVRAVGVAVGLAVSVLGVLANGLLGSSLRMRKRLDLLVCRGSGSWRSSSCRWSRTCRIGPAQTLHHSHSQGRSMGPRWSCRFLSGGRWKS